MNSSNSKSNGHCALVSKIRITGLVGSSSFCNCLTLFRLYINIKLSVLVEVIREM